VLVEKGLANLQNQQKMHTNTFFCIYSKHLKPRATVNVVEKILLVTDETENKKQCRKIIQNVSSLKN
jgi:hypothetical protein